MNHTQHVYEYIGKVVEVYDGRLVRITGVATPGNAFCEAADGGSPIYDVSSAFLQPERVR